MIRPTHFTTVEGGEWYPWPGDEEFPEKQLRSSLWNGHGAYAGGLFFHSIKVAPYGEEWDAINGWRV